MTDSFVNTLGYRLHGELQKVESDHCVILCHGYGSNSQGDTRVQLAKKLAENNISSFGFDFTGCGKSGGALAELTVTQGLDDLTYAYNYVKNNLGFKKISLLGSSFSGSVALLFAAEHPELRKLALKSPVSDWQDIQQMSFLNEEESKKYLDDARRYNLYETAKKIKQQSLIIHGTDDELVPFEQSQKLDSILPASVLLGIEGADHRYSNSEHFSTMIAQLVDFFTTDK